MCSELKQHDCWPILIYRDSWETEKRVCRHVLSLHELLIIGVCWFGCVIVVASLDAWWTMDPSPRILDNHLFL